MLLEQASLSWNFNDYGSGWGPWEVSNAYPIPGLTYLQDIEDIVPNNVLYNLEHQADTPASLTGVLTVLTFWSVMEPIQDNEDNYRLDGDYNAIYTTEHNESHSSIAHWGSTAFDDNVVGLSSYYQLYPLSLPLEWYGL